MPHAILTFLVGSILSGMAGTMTQLIIFRAIQGVGGGGLMIGSQAVGGFFTDSIGWRWIFYINIPLGIVALGTVVFALHLPRPSGLKLQMVEGVSATKSGSCSSRSRLRC